MDPSRLAHVIIPGDNMVGEFVGWDGDFIKLKNPKRLIKQQGMHPTRGLMVSISMVDWDMMDEGVIFVKPICHFLVREQNEETQRRYFGIYIGHLQDKVVQAARDAGLEISATSEQVKQAARASSIFESGKGVRSAG